MMTDIRVRFVPPGTNEPVPGTVTFTARHVDGNRPVVDGQDIILGAPQRFDIPAEGATISLRPTGPGWYYSVQGRAGDHSFSTNKLVPPTGPVDFESLVRFDPKVGLAYEPDPDWWSHLDVIEAGFEGTQADLHAARDSAEAARDTAQGYRDELGSIVDQAVADGFPLAGSDNAGLMSAPDKVRLDKSPVNPANYGAVGDGAADDTTALQNAINAAASAGLPVFIPGGRYRITATINVPSGTVMRGAGMGKTIIDMKAMGSTLTSSKTAFQSLGTVGASRGITADVLRGAKTAEVTDAATHYAVGDRVLLSSDQAFHVSVVKRGEIKRVEAVSGTHVTFEDATYDSYAAASGAKLQKLNLVRDITLQDFTLEGTDTDNMERGYYCYVGENINVLRCEFNFTDWNSVNLRHVTNFGVNNNTFRNVDWVDNLPNYYGLTVENATAHGTFTGNHGTKCRHLFTTGFTTTVPGVARFIVVSGNTDTYSQSASYDTHDGSEFITFTGNTSSYSEFNGINCEGRETLITDNHIINFSSTLGGIYVRAAAENVTVRGNRVISTVNGAFGVYIRRTYTFRPRRVAVEGNIVDVPNNGSAIRLLDVDDCTVTGNHIGPCGNGVVLISGSNGCQVEGNSVAEVTGYALQARSSTGTRFIGNRTTSGTGAVYLSESARTIVANNTAGGVTHGVRMHESATGSQTNTVVIGNDFTEVTGVILRDMMGTRKIVGNLGVADSSA